jgi:hypothetical protein
VFEHCDGALEIEVVIASSERELASFIGRSLADHCASDRLVVVLEVVAASL